MPKIPPLVFEPPAIELPDVRGAWLEVLAPLSDASEQLGRSLASALGTGRQVESTFRESAARALEGLLRVVEAHQWTLEELTRYADALECDSVEEFRDAGAFCGKRLGRLKKLQTQGMSMPLRWCSASRLVLWRRSLGNWRAMGA